MYVNPFWLGVLVTVGSELFALVVTAIILSMKKGGKK